MLYFTTAQGQTFMVLEPTNMDRLKEGKPAISPDKKVILLYTPDVEWFEAQMRSRFSNDVSVKELNDLHIESQSRSEVRR